MIITQNSDYVWIWQDIELEIVSEILRWKCLISPLSLWKTRFLIKITHDLPVKNSLVKYFNWPCILRKPHDFFACVVLAKIILSIYFMCYCWTKWYNNCIVCQSEWNCQVVRVLIIIIWQGVNLNADWGYANVWMPLYEIKWKC